MLFKIQYFQIITRIAENSKSPETAENIMKQWSEGPLALCPRDPWPCVTADSLPGYRQRVDTRIYSGGRRGGMRNLLKTAPPSLTKLKIVSAPAAMSEASAVFPLALETH